MDNIFNLRLHLIFTLPVIVKGSLSLLFSSSVYCKSYTCKSKVLLNRKYSQIVFGGQSGGASLIWLFGTFLPSVGVTIKAVTIFM